jgi:hypothetical protein
MDKIDQHFLTNNPSYN